MPNQPNVNNHLIGVRVSVETYHKLLRLAQGVASRVPGIVRAIVAAKVEPIELTLDEQRAVLAEIEENARKQGRM